MPARNRLPAAALTNLLCLVRLPPPADPAAASSASPTALERVAGLLADGTALATACAAPGWLLAAAATEGGACEAMAALHAGVLASLKVGGSRLGADEFQSQSISAGDLRLPASASRLHYCPHLQPLPAFKQESGLDRLALLRLPQADYPTGTSAARALHRRLRQLGGGSLREGLAVLTTTEEEQRSLAAALGGVEPEVSWVAAGRPCKADAGVQACITQDTIRTRRSIASLHPLQAVRADAEHILGAGLAPPDTATAASSAAACDAAVAAHRASLERVFAAFGEFARPWAGCWLKMALQRCTALAATTHEVHFC